MSELKAGVLVTPHNEGMCFHRGSDVIGVTEGETEFYLKPEADTVIAHHKFKRCLAMAKWCYDRWIRTYYLNKIEKTRFYVRWHKRWLELAKKFKEAK